MQDKYTHEKLNVILLSTDSSEKLYHSRAEKLFKEYGGGNWPSVILPDGFTSALRFGGFGYGKLIIDADGIIRSVGEYGLEKSLERIFGQ